MGVLKDIEYPDLKVYLSEEKTKPVAKEIVSLLIGKKFSYLECFEALEIAKGEIMTAYPASSDI